MITTKANFPYASDKPEYVLNQARYWRISSNRVIDLYDSASFNRKVYGAKVGSGEPAWKHIKIWLTNSYSGLYRIAATKWDILQNTTALGATTGHWPTTYSTEYGWLINSPLWKRLQEIEEAETSDSLTVSYPDGTVKKIALPPGTSVELTRT